MNRILLAITIFAASLTAWADTFKPFEVANVTRDQLETFKDEVESLYDGTAQHFPDQNLVVYSNNEEAMNYAFTTKGHPAHPAWITRQVVESEDTVDIKQIGYFAGDEEPFAKLFQQYLELNDKIKASMQGSN
ncbi:hypothetical protein ACMG4M_01150 [Alcanivorax sp. IL3]|uniref:hypothetical protein n=1 Tax=unclassified Alcanivorax TaxID=2638842 RepID=UPI0039C3337B